MIDRQTNQVNILELIGTGNHKPKISAVYPKLQPIKLHFLHSVTDGLTIE